MYGWIRSIQPVKPLIVILEEVADEAGTRYRRKDGGYFNKGASAETKWMKRFRRDILNRIDITSRAYRELVNPGE